MNFAQLALICAVALLGPLLNVQRRLRLPVVIGELVVGVALGASGLQVLRAGEPTFAFLAEIGFALVMFVAGSHVPLRSPALRAGLRVGAARAVLVGALSVAAGAGIAAVFGTGHGALYAVLLASSSAGLVMPALAGMPLTAPAIVAMLPQIALADAACIVLLPLAIDPAAAPRAALGSLAVLTAAALVWLVLRWLERSGLRRRVHETSEDHQLAVELRTLLALLFGLAAIASVTHVSIMLAGFAMGLAVAGVGEPRRVAKQLFALTEGFFGPLFFVWLGSSLDLRDLLAHPRAVALGLVLGIAAVAVHAAMVATRQPFPVAAFTAAQLGVPIAAAALGTTHGLLGEGEPTALLLGALVTVVTTVLLGSRLAAVASAGVGPAEDGTGNAPGGPTPSATPDGSP